MTRQEKKSMFDLFSYTLCLTISLSVSTISKAQNLVPNGDFEIYSTCPFVVDNTGPMPCPPWVSVFSANYFNACSPFPSGVPYNFIGYQPAHSGAGYIGEYTASDAGIVREFVRVPLDQALVAGTCYEVSFYINLGNGTCGSDRIGALFTNTIVATPMNMIPQINWIGTFLTDTLGWMHIYGSFTAVGGEQHLYLGNFYPDNQTQFSPSCFGPNIWSYYYFDDVVVQESTPEDFTLDLGGPYAVCDQVNLTAGILNANYTWSNGFHTQSITVNQTGTYSVTVTKNCTTHEASANVTIIGSPPVSIGPNVDLCAGESIVITLDGSAGSYIWQDGSTSTSYTISSTGTYSVTLDDGCDITWDDIHVNVNDPPEPFSLGPDAVLCPGDELFISFNPSLGNFTWQDGSGNSFYHIVNDGTYSLTIGNNCGVESDQIEVTSLVPPDISLGPDSLLLCTGHVINLNFDPGLGNFTWQDGSTNPTYTISQTGQYGLTVSNVCGTGTDQIYVSQIHEPVVTLHSTYHICPGDDLILETGSNFGEFLWQDGSTDPEYIVTASGVYSVTVSNDCGMDSGSAVVDIEDDISPPDLGPDTTICNGELLYLEVDPIGNITWNDGSTDPVLEVTTSGTYIVHVETDCESYSDTIEVDISDQGPELHLPADFSLCQGGTTILNAGIANVSYLWNSGSTLSQINVSAPGTYSLTISNTCGTDADTVTIVDGGPSPVVSLGVDTSVCANASITLSPSFANVDNWLWPDGSDTTFYVGSALQQVYVQVSNTCGVAYDTINIGELPAVPILALGPDTSICPGQSVTLSIQVPNVTILWFDGSTTSDLTVSDSTRVVASISNTCGTSTDTLNVDLLPDIPQLYLGTDQIICPGEVITVSPGIANVNYLWQDGSTNSSFQIMNQGIIMLTISNACGATSDTMEIFESTDGPQLDLGPDLKACEGETITIPSGILGVSYLWQDGSTDDHFIATASGTYSLMVENLCGVDRDTIDVVISGTPPVADLGSDTTLCIGASLTLSAHPEPLTSIVWQDGSNGDDFIVNATGIYTLTKTNECGSDKDSIEILINKQTPFAELGSDTSLCEGSLLTLNVNVNTGTSAVWQDGSSTDNYVVDQSGIYSITLSNVCGIYHDTIEVDLNKKTPLPDLGPDTSLCSGSTLMLLSHADQGTQILWQDGSQHASLMVNSPGVYILNESNDCGVGVDSIQVNFIDSPAAFDLGPDTILCPGESILLSAPSTINTILWQDGSNLQTIVADKEIKYLLRIKNGCGEAKDSLSLAFDHHTPVIPVDESILWCAGDTVTIDATQSFPAAYTWSTGEKSPLIRVFTPGTYNVDVAALCASASAEIDVVEDVDCSPSVEIYVPNIFSPNGDGANDVFNVVVNGDLNVISMEGSINDRWGDQVHTQTGVSFTWDGYFKGKKILPGVYVYNIVVKYLFNGNVVEKRLIGDVTLIR
ncbi:MAG: gliding motility-associated C-terminal domain-containing protein [Saprospiraceae bacterium]